MLKSLVKRAVPERLVRGAARAVRSYQGLKPIAKRDCNVCGFSGWFESMGRPPRLDAMCPKCGSVERHRLLMLALQRKQIPLRVAEGDRVLHFAPEWVLERLFRSTWSGYVSADLYSKADLKLNLERIELPDRSVKLVIASHVLEHVDDFKASREICRILHPDGLLIYMVPIVEGWDRTYEDAAVKSDEMRWLHYGQNDHVRFYGHDFRQRIESGGLRLATEITAEGPDVVKHGLLRGEKVFVFRRA
ncbi:MAG: class I SAM-dependent methyltransferase [Comamonadaceae bacterium]|nr:class I SAM-dependent methyltransferase [Comamonadaceae bacterium]